MQRILNQEDVLKGDKETAEKNVKYTWNMNEIAWRYCETSHSVSKIRFTGSRWIVGNKWGYTKIYQFEELSSSSDMKSSDELCHDDERSFFETLESACDYAKSHIKKLIEFQEKFLKGNMDKVDVYRLRETTFKKEIITEKNFNLNE